MNLGEVKDVVREHFGCIGAAAGTSPIVGCSVTWEEVKI